MNAKIMVGGWSRGPKGGLRRKTKTGRWEYSRHDLSEHRSVYIDAVRGTNVVKPGSVQAKQLHEWLTKRVRAAYPDADKGTHRRMAKVHSDAFDVEKGPLRKRIHARLWMVHSDLSR